MSYSNRKKVTKRKTLAILGICLSIMLLPGRDVVKAGFVDDWLSQKTQTAPGYFEGQKRGYFTGGGFSAHWKQSNDYIASFDPPKLQFGCGGVDAFLGGFSFLNTEYLVQKLQRIMQAAPAMAFDMALNVLCEPCSNIMKSMEAISDALNDLQLSDCKAGKVVTAKVLNQFSDNGKIKAEADKDYNIGKGIMDLPHKLTEIWTSTGGNSSKTTPDLTNACSNDVKAIFNTPGQTVLQALGEKRGLPSSHVDLMRGLVGDVKIVPSTVTDEWGTRTDTKAVYVQPCSENAYVNLDRIYQGNVYLKSASETCTLVPDTHANLVNWVSDTMSTIAMKVEYKSTQKLTDAQKGFLNAVGLPIHNALKVAIASEQSPFVMSMLSETAAKTYAYGLIRDLVVSARQSVLTARSILSRQGEHKIDCQINLFAPIVEALKDFDSKGTDMLSRLHEDYQRVLSEMVSYDNFAKRYEDFNNIALTKLSVMFKPSVARRAVGQQ